MGVDTEWFCTQCSETLPREVWAGWESPGTEEEPMKELTHISEGQAGAGHDC